MNYKKVKIFRNGYYCGYVGLEPSHPYYGKDYDELSYIDVHGGLTFSNSHIPNIPETLNDGLWYVGFDCNHFGDRTLFEPKELGRFRTTEYVNHELDCLVCELQSYE